MIIHPQKKFSPSFLYIYGDGPIFMTVAGQAGTP